MCCDSHSIGNHRDNELDIIPRTPHACFVAMAYRQIKVMLEIWKKSCSRTHGLEVIKLYFILKLKKAQ